MIIVGLGFGVQGLGLSGQELATLGVSGTCLQF